ncbi:MAG: TVP38/TMEM64 family protein [Bacilli bacterium]
MKNKGKFKNLIVFAICFSIGILIVWQTGFIDFIKDVDAMQEFFNDFGIVGYLVYILIYIIVAVFMLPASIFTIIAGITFGPIIGALVALSGATVGACVSFLIARYVARDLIISKFEDNPIFKKVEKGVEENGVSFLILTRLVPVFPYNIQNYAYGLTKIRFTTYAFITAICMAPGAFIYAFMAGEIVKNGVSIKLLIQFSVAGIILFVVSLIPKYIAKKNGITLEK